MSGEWQTLLDRRGVGVERRRDAGRLTAAVVGGLLALATTGCVGTADDDVRLSPTTMRVGNTDVYTYQLVCPSPVGNLSTSIEFSVTDSLEDVSTGDTVTYTITAPLAQVQTPVTPTFESSTTTYRIPKGLDVTSATMDPTKNSDFTSTSTTVTDTEVSFTLKGDFPLDGTPRTTPGHRLADADLDRRSGVRAGARVPDLELLVPRERAHRHDERALGATEPQARPPAARSERCRRERCACGQTAAAL